MKDNAEERKARALRALSMIAENKPLTEEQQKKKEEREKKWEEERIERAKTRADFRFEDDIIFINGVPSFRFVGEPVYMMIKDDETEEEWDMRLDREFEKAGIQMGRGDMETIAWNSSKIWSYDIRGNGEIFYFWEDNGDLLTQYSGFAVRLEKIDHRR